MAERSARVRFLGMRQAITLVWASLLAFAAMGARVAAAQQAGGNGIKIGEGRLHPFFDLELRFDSAAGFFAQGGATTVTLQPELLAHIRPGLRLDVPADTWGLTLAGNVDYVYYTGVFTPGSQAGSRLEGSADLSASFNRRGPFEVRVGNHFARSDRTSNVALGVGVISMFNEAQVAVAIHPGGGALEITPKGAYIFELFNPVSLVPVTGCAGGDPTCDPTQVQTMNYHSLKFGLEGRWKFLPKTAVVLDSSFDIRNYFSAGASNAPALLLKASAGLAGLVTTKVALVAKLGWGYDFAGSGANTPVAHVELNYALNETTRLKAGYLRNLEPVPAFGVHGDDRGFVDARALLGGRLTLHGSAAFDYLTFYAAPPRTGRTDMMFSMDLGPEYQFAPWLIGALDYVLAVRGSSQPAASTNFTRHEVYARITLTY